MAAVLEFVRQIADNQDWSPSERAQLREMGVQLAGIDDDLDVVFGQSEDGDPWCVVTDGAGEVVLHVARIRGAFVVHSARDDRIVEGPELWNTAARILGDALKDRRGVVLPFRTAEALSQFVIFALVFAAALHTDLGGLLDGLPGRRNDSRDHADSPDDGSGHDLAALDRHGPGHQAAAGSVPPGEEISGAQPAHAPEAAPGDLAFSSEPADAWALFFPPAEHPLVQQGGVTVSPQGSPQQQAGAGDPMAGAVLQVQPELVRGDAGDNQIPLGEHVFALGGKGADTFVLDLPAQPAHSSQKPVLLGAVLDFNAAEGDTFAFSRGGKGVIVTDRPEANVLSDLGPTPVSRNLPPVPGRHVGYDVNGDGVEDAYVLVADGSATTAGRTGKFNYPGTAGGGGNPPQHAPTTTDDHSYQSFGGPETPSISRPYDMEF